MTVHTTLPAAFVLQSPIHEPLQSKEMSPPEKVARYRAVSGLSRKNAAALVGYSGETWKGWETGRRPMRESLLAKFASEYEKLQELIDRREDEAREQRARAWNVKPSTRPPSTPRPSPTPPEPEPDWILRFTHERNAPTAQQDEECARDLASGIELTPAQVAAALREFEEEQRTLAKRADALALAQRQESEQILAQE